ncbi:2-dehydro-3-deoxygalactonokinase [Pseudomonas sp. PS1]|uniref:2-dehydro-3-deoxygalactonokinase n=1 Tax=Stutzerimonas marianensis TaxID=2929513 RepID=A0A9X1W4V6_9GAMM|nr:2-dehydro-3-deoxygalactonokinase [Pseudomonas marianensis]MCJ0974817.1 2-dehydro-3-deoxygalactonokinase [Pseudomonas marianensis]
MSEPCLIGIDWGTSSLRAYLLGQDASLLDSRAQPWGIQYTPDRDFARAYRLLLEDWLAQWPGLPAIASGMIGSRQGWCEVPYVDCPADASALAAAMVCLETGVGRLHLVPGVRQLGSRPNVLRGEETQVFGAIALKPELADDALLLLPGTHSKWVEVQYGRLQAFSTFMTGELFAVLRDHSILGRPALEAGAISDADTFIRGVQTARDSGSRGIADCLFGVRSLVLCNELQPNQSLEYLSGLLIGEELRSALGGTASASVPVLLGDPSLCARYRLAMESFDVQTAKPIKNPGTAGLWQIAEAAGLVKAKGVQGV